MAGTESPWVHVPRRQPTIDPAELVAIRAVMLTVLATMATQIEAAGGPSPQLWLNHLSACCQEAIFASDVSDGGDQPAFKARIVEQVNRLLGSVHFPATGQLDS